MYDWYDHPIDRRATRTGELGVNGKLYKGGEFLPFYIPRPVMPQLDEKDYPEFLQFVKNQGVSIDLKEYRPQQLRAHQRVTWDSVVNMAPDVFNKPILASIEPFVLDGNHRWTAHVRKAVPLSGYEIGLEFEDAIKLMFSFPKTYAYGDGKEHPLAS